MNEFLPHAFVLAVNVELQRDPFLRFSFREVLQNNFPGFVQFKFSGISKISIIHPLFCRLITPDFELQLISFPTGYTYSIRYIILFFWCSY